jgi:hypothetical protein
LVIKTAATSIVDDASDFVRVFQFDVREIGVAWKPPPSLAIDVPNLARY